MKVQVIVAIEPRSYRQVIGEALRALRPHIEVTVLDPDTLRAGVARLDPELVFSNQPDTFAPTGRPATGRASTGRASTGRPATGRPAWVQFLPYEELPARICLAGRRRELEHVELDDLLSIVDEAEELARTRRELGNC